VKRLLLMLFVTLVSAPAFAKGAACDEYTIERLEDALEYLNMDTTDLGFYKGWDNPDPFRLQLVDSMMRNPLYIPEFGDEVIEVFSSFDTNFADGYLFLAKALDIKTRGIKPGRIVRRIRSSSRKKNVLVDTLPLPGKVKRGIKELLFSVGQSAYYLESAFDSLSYEDRGVLLCDAPTIWLETNEEEPPDTLRGYLLRRFGEDKDTIEYFKERDITVREAAYKIDRKKLLLSSLYLFLGVSLAEEQFSALDSLEIAHLPRMETDSIVGDVILTLDTEYGRLVIGDTVDNRYLGYFPFVVDIGGDDMYLSPVATAIYRYLSSVSFAVDLSGNDIYDFSDDFSFGSSLLGVSYLLDCSGNDIYRGASYSQGSSICGVGFLFDMSGIDSYSGIGSLQGAGTFGVGVLADFCGNDSYDAAIYAQGFGSVYGAGCLLDGSGNDTYTAGRVYLHKPLYSDRYRSMSQGFGFGWRPGTSGGIGVLFDRSGNDYYTADIYGQGASYWFAFGMLTDMDGNDSYTSVHYSQGAGVHLSVGYLYDAAGSDTYVGLHGPAQGGGHDFAVGVLLDESGDDYYTSDGIGQGYGHANGLGIFIDKSGNDAYMGRFPKWTQGAGSKARGYGSVGIFLDMAGNDIYNTDGGKNNSIWTKGFWGAGIDEEREDDE